MSWLLVALALAEDGEEAVAQTTYGGGLAPVSTLPAVSAPRPDGVVVGTEYAPQVYVGAAALSLDVAYVDSLRAGLELLYLRDYAGVHNHFLAVEAAHPGAAVDAVADVLMYQAMMFENYDFRFETQWEASSRRARAALEKAVTVPGEDAWEEFLFAGVSGIESIHAMRKEQYLGGLSLAFEAMDHAERSRSLAPGFPDLLLADGLYNYWRTVITESSRVLPRFGDQRAQGIAEMIAVEKDGVFVQSLATMSIAYSWVEEGRPDEAIVSCEKNRAAYPNSVINNLVTGRTYVTLRKYDTALAIFDNVLVTDPTNRYVHYYRGVAEMRSGKLATAETSLNTYLAFPGLMSWQQSNAYYRLGQLHYRQKSYDLAEADWQRAVKIDGHDPSKQLLAKLKEARKKGTLPSP